MAKEGKEVKAKLREDSELQPKGITEQFLLDADRFKALGDPIRLAVINFLSARESASALPKDSSLDGATVSEIACALTGKSGKEPSTLSHHLKELRHAGLVVMTRHGKNLCYRIESNAISLLCDRLNIQTLISKEPAKDADTVINE